MARRHLLASVSLVIAVGCGDTINSGTSSDGGASCDPDVVVLCICPGPTIGEQECSGGVSGGCDCSNPISPGECQTGETAVACICDDGQIGEQSCVDGASGGCGCPDPIPPEQCRSDLDCSDGAFCNGVEHCEPNADDANARGCAPSGAPPICDDGVDCTADRCSDEHDRCLFDAPDLDGDGHADATRLGADGGALGDDCDDDDSDNLMPVSSAMVSRTPRTAACR